jgi:hypothetical protein
MYHIDEYIYFDDVTDDKDAYAINIVEVFGERDWDVHAQGECENIEVIDDKVYMVFAQGYMVYQTDLKATEVYSVDSAKYMEITNDIYLNDLTAMNYADTIGSITGAPVSKYILEYVSDDKAIYLDYASDTDSYVVYDLKTGKSKSLFDGITLDSYTHPLGVIDNRLYIDSFGILSDSIEIED